MAAPQQQQSDAPGPDSGSSGREKPKQGGDCFLAFCRLINTLTAISAFLCLVAHSMALASGPPLFSVDGARLQILRMYGVGVALLIMLVETEWHWLLDGMRVLDNWLGRALLQGLLVVMTLELATSPGTSDFDMSIRLYRQVAAYCMMACAAFYAIGGVLCFAALKRARHRRQSERLRVENDLADLERQREELQGLLAVYTRE